MDRRKTGIYTIRQLQDNGLAKLVHLLASQLAEDAAFFGVVDKIFLCGPYSPDSCRRAQAVDDPQLTLDMPRLVAGKPITISDLALVKLARVLGQAPRFLAPPPPALLEWNSALSD